MAKFLPSALADGTIGSYGCPRPRVRLGLATGVDGAECKKVYAYRQGIEGDYHDRYCPTH